MQGDEYNYQSDEQFTDKAWVNMHELLDKEMPVEKKKRRGFFWLFFLLGIGIVGAVWIFSPKTTEPIVEEVQRNNSSESVKNLPTPNQEKSTYENNNTNTELKNSNSNSNSKLKSGKQKTAIIADASIYETSKKVFTRENVSVRKNKISTSKNTVIQNSETQIEEDLFHNNKITNSIGVKKMGLVENISPAFLTLKLLEEKERLIDLDFSASEEESVVEALEPPKRKIDFGLYAGTLLDFSNNQVGGFGGGSVHFPLGEKVGLQTGIGYAMLPKKLNYNFYSTQEALVEASAVTITNQERAVVESQIEFVLAKMHYLEVPLLLTYAPIKKLQFQVGMSGAYLLTDQLDLTNNELNVSSDFSSYNLDELKTDSYSQAPYQETFLWNRWDMSSVVGLAWKPTSRWSVGVQYHHGWISFLETNEAGIKVGNISNNISGISNSGGYVVANDPIVPSIPINSGFPDRSSISKNKNYNRSIRLSIGYNF